MSTINELSVKSTVSDLFDWKESKIALIISVLKNTSCNYGRAECLSARIEYLFDVGALLRSVWTVILKHFDLYAIFLRRRSTLRAEIQAKFDYFSHSSFEPMMSSCEEKYAYNCCQLSGGAGMRSS
jgi:hypothetical protein